MKVRNLLNILVVLSMLLLAACQAAPEPVGEPAAATEAPAAEAPAAEAPAAERRPLVSWPRRFPIRKAPCWPAAGSL